MTQPSLVILAAGMGSRYGGLKQIDAFGPNGEAIIDYSIYDAILAGFKKIVFIIREEFRADFEAFFEGKFDDHVEVHYIAQNITDVPDGFEVPDHRSRPWGTAHAVWTARNVINEPFAVINADDFYGREAYKVMYELLHPLSPQNNAYYCTVTYYLKNTLSEHGTVNRGVCDVDDRGNLVKVTERKNIKRNAEGQIVFDCDSDQPMPLEENTLVSMNLWGFVPAYFLHTERYFKTFLKDHGHEERSELYIPDVITNIQKENLGKVVVKASPSDWFGVTYKEDKPFVQEKINALIEQKTYPLNLWR